MLIRISDIPASGRDVNFELDLDSLNGRVSAAQGLEGETTAPPCVFFAPVRASLRLTLEGSTVFIDGLVAGRYLTVCSRCAEETEQEISTKVVMVLKPKSQRGPVEASDEDLNFGFYEDKVVDCAPIAEELLILAIPYAQTCSEQCRGLCAGCGQNLNTANCDCERPKGLDPRLVALRDIKITH